MWPILKISWGVYSSSALILHAVYLVFDYSPVCRSRTHEFILTTMGYLKAPFSSLSAVMHVFLYYMNLNWISTWMIILYLHRCDTLVEYVCTCQHRIIKMDHKWMVHISLLLYSRINISSFIFWPLYFGCLYMCY